MDKLKLCVSSLLHTVLIPNSKIAGFSFSNKIYKTVKCAQKD